MRTLAAIAAYLLAAFGGLAAGYYATAPRATAAPALARASGHEPHWGRGTPADLEAVAAFLAADEGGAEQDAQPTSADL
jgi:hypothetical protein